MGANSAATFCGQPHKEALAQGHNNKVELRPAAGCEVEVVAPIPYCFVSLTSRSPGFTPDWE